MYKNSKKSINVYQYDTSTCMISPFRASDNVIRGSSFLNPLVLQDERVKKNYTPATQFTQKKILIFGRQISNCAYNFYHKTLG